MTKCGDHFNFRLHGAILSNRRNRLTNQAFSETKLLKTYKVELPTHQTDKHMYEIDDVAVSILDHFQPVINSVYIPLLTVGDGNCLYRAVSLALTGSEQYHVLLRLLTALELINNRSYYDTKKAHNNFLHDIRIVTSEYNKLLKDCVQLNSYSEMGHLRALSAALGETIQSYFPPQLKTELSSAFTQIVVGPGVIKDKTPRIMIMWTSMSTPPSLSAFTANHFVPLINKPQTTPDKSSLLPISIGAYGGDEPVTLSDISVRNLSSDQYQVYPDESSLLAEEETSGTSHMSSDQYPPLSG